MPAEKLPDLSDAQRVILAEIVRYYLATGEPCTVSYLGRKLGKSRAAIRFHLDIMCRKGWIPAPCVPGTAPISEQK